MIVIYGIDSHLNPIKTNMADVIQQCMQDALKLPEDTSAYRFIPLEKSNFFYPAGRSDAYTVVEVNMMEGRTQDAKKVLIKRLFELFEEKLDISPTDLEITIKEQPAHCWGFRGLTGDEAKLDYPVKV